MASTTIVEIAVQDPAGARVAFGAGADRVEVCQALGTGGLTPSLGTVELAISAAGDAKRVAPLVRPRGGGFVYDAEEIDTVARDIRRFAALGVGAVVVGCLTDSRTIDRITLSHWVDVAQGCGVVFHRAMDVTADPTAALDVLIEAQVDRVLTSGGAARCIDGIALLRRLSARAAGRIQIMAGGGVRVEDIVRLRETGVDAVHLSARRAVKDDAPSGPGGGPAAPREMTDFATVRAAVHAAHA